MSALDDVLGHLPEAERANYVRIAGRYGIGDNAPELISATLILEAVGARVDAALSAIHAVRDEILPLAEETPARIEAVLRTQAEPLAMTMASVIGPAVVSELKTEISANLSAQHDVAMESHERAKRAISNLETAVASKFDRITEKARAALQMHGAWYPAAMFVLGLIIVLQLHGTWVFTAAGFSAGKYAQYHADATLYQRDPMKWRIETEGHK